MATPSPEVQQTLATAPAPAEEFQSLSRERRREVFIQLPETVKASLVADVDDAALWRFVGGLDPDKATDVPGPAEEGRQAAILEQLDSERREKVGYLPEFGPETAAGLMTSTTSRSTPGGVSRRSPSALGVSMVLNLVIAGFFVFLGLAKLVLV